MKMSQVKRQLFYALALFYLNWLGQDANAEIATAAGTPINSLYDNLLQREYAGPVVFPNHQVERKAQRSPSLRLRFGRSDPDMLNNIMQKRWFGDVNQKPIRSPSLRLRFGRRSDPNVPRRTSYDDLLERELSLNDANVDADYNDAVALYDAYERVVRKPQRLRWGRSVHYEPTTADDMELEQEQENERYNSLMNSNKLRNILLALRQYDIAHAQIENGLTTEIEDLPETDEFEREVRKPGPLRLRWGRSTGVAPTEQKVVPHTEQPVEKAQN